MFPPALLLRTWRTAVSRKSAVRHGLHDLTPTLAACGLTRILASLHLLDQELERLLDVLVVPRTCFRPATLELLRELLAVLGGDLALLGAKVRLVTDDDDGNPVDCLY